MVQKMKRREGTSGEEKVYDSMHRIQKNKKFRFCLSLTIHNKIKPEQNRSGIPV